MFYYDVDMKIQQSPGLVGIVNSSDHDVELGPKKKKEGALINATKSNRHNPEAYVPWAKKLVRY